jgi:predicted glutamine amidotransferase
VPIHGGDDDVDASLADHAIGVMTVAPRAWRIGATTTRPKGAAHVPLARLLGISDPPQGSALHSGSLARRPEPALAAGAETTNGDGFGVGWYGDSHTPGVFHSTEPAWNDHNLHELANHISSSHFFTHIRAAIGSAVQQSNCHPFRHDRWLFMHNGYINEFATIKRDLVLAVDPSLYPKIQGQTDSEVLFYVALTFGLEDDPLAAIERAIGLVEAVGSRLGVPNPFQGTIATTDGESTWAVRYSSEGKSRSLYYTTDVPTLRQLYPERQLLRDLSEDARLIVSEPLGDVGRHHDEMRPFHPRTPSKFVPVVA